MYFSPTFIGNVDSTTAPSSSLLELAAVLVGGELLDYLPDTVFFLKDVAGRYLAVNTTLVERCQRRRKTELIGRTVADFFPAELARNYFAQDRRVVATGEPIVNKLELHLYPSRQPGWCLTTKLPLRDRMGRIIGLAGLSRDLHPTANATRLPPALAEVVDYLDGHYSEPVSVRILARRANLTPVKFTSLVKRIFQVTPLQLLLQRRLNAGARRLRDSEDSVAAVAQACGFYDHSAFSRQFKLATGLTPLAYRRSVC